MGGREWGGVGQLSHWEGKESALNKIEHCRLRQPFWRIVVRLLDEGGGI